MFSLQLLSGQVPYLASETVYYLGNPCLRRSELKSTALLHGLWDLVWAGLDGVGTGLTDSQHTRDRVTSMYVHSQVCNRSVYPVYTGV